MRNKLIPLRLLIPDGPGLHEWTRAYRNLIFEMADFVRERGGKASLDLAREFARTSRQEVAAFFTESELYLLLTKAKEYELPAPAPRSQQSLSGN